MCIFTGFFSSKKEHHENNFILIVILNTHKRSDLDRRKKERGEIIILLTHYLVEKSKSAHIFFKPILCKLITERNRKKTNCSLWYHRSILRTFSRFFRQNVGNWEQLENSHWQFVAKKITKNIHHNVHTTNTSSSNKYDSVEHVCF